MKEEMFQDNGNCHSKDIKVSLYDQRIDVFDNHLVSGNAKLMILLFKWTLNMS